MSKKAPIDIIQLEPHDDVVSVRDRLSFVESYRVLLLWPDGGQSVLQRKLDLVLVQREAKRRGARLALVTRDRQVITYADDLNISTYPSIEEARRERWKRGRSKVFVDRSDKPLNEPDPLTLRDAASRRRMAPTATQRRLRQLSRLMAVAMLLTILAGTIALFVPAATVTVVPAREHLDVTIRVVADPEVQTVDLKNGIVPATLLRLEIEETASVETTGNENSPPTLASGSVIFTNQTDQAVTIPAGTTVNTSTGTIVRYRTTDPVNVAGEVGAIAVVAIEALSQFAGTVGNVPANAINFVDGPLNDLLTVQNTDPTSGGSQPVSRVVTQADHDRLLAAVRGAIQYRALSELTPMLGERQTIIEESIRIAEVRPEWISYDAAVGETANAVGLAMRAVVQAVVIDERMVNQVAFAGLTERIPAGQVVIPESMAFSRGAIELIDGNDRVTFLAAVNGDVTGRVNLDQIRQAITGMPVDSALAYIQQNVALAPSSSPQIAVWPPVFNRLPLLPARITITIRGTA